MAKLQRGASSAQLNEDQVDEFKEAFELFDQEKSGAITKDVLKNVCSQFGIRVTNDELDTMFNEVDTTKKGKFGFPEFMSMMAKKLKQTSTEQQLTRAFKTFDKEENGWIDTAELTEILCNNGDKLNKREMQELRSVCENDKSQLKYQVFVDMMFAKK